MTDILDYYTVPDFLESITDPFQKLVTYALIFALVSLMQAYVVKRKLLIKKPQNTINMVVWCIVAVTITRFEGIPQTAHVFMIALYLATEYIAHRLFPIDEGVIYVLETDLQNIIVDEYIFYVTGGTLCVALQDNRSIIKRLFFGKNVIVEVNASTKWTEDYERQLWLCNSYEIKVIKPLAKGTTKKGIRARIHDYILGEKSIVMALDVIDAHDVSRLDLMLHTKVLDYLVERHEKLAINYTKLRTLLTALLIRKQQKVLLSALKTFEDSVTITEQERKMIQQHTTELPEKADYVKKLEGEMEAE